MKRRKNAVYTGQSNRVSTRSSDPRLVGSFYRKLTQCLLPEDEIEIIPPEQVRPQHDLSNQMFIMADYCVRKILPEVTGMFRWSDTHTLQLRALAPIVNKETAEPVEDVVNIAADDFGEAEFDLSHETGSGAVAAARRAAWAVTDVVFYTIKGASHFTFGAQHCAECVYNALVVCLEVGDEAAYDRIIALTNEMLESL